MALRAGSPESRTAQDEEERNNKNTLRENESRQGHGYTSSYKIDIVAASGAFFLDYLWLSESRRAHSGMPTLFNLKGGALH
jgi:hypothetical protein